MLLWISFKTFLFCFSDYFGNIFVPRLISGGGGGGDINTYDSHDTGILHIKLPHCTSFKGKEIKF